MLGEVRYVVVDDLKGRSLCVVDDVRGRSLFVVEGIKESRRC